MANSPSCTAAPSSSSCSPAAGVIPWTAKVRRLARILIGVALAIGSIAPVSAERLAIRTFTATDGLPRDQVTAFLADSRGFLWLGTQEGLARFHGGQFTLFGPAEGLANAAIYDLIEDRGGRYWIATGGGVYRFTPSPRESGAGANNLWSTPQNWDGNVAPVSGDFVSFPNVALQTTNVNDLPAGTLFSSIQFLGTYIVTGNRVLIDNNIRVNGANGILVLFACDITTGGNGATELFIDIGAGRFLITTGVISGAQPLPENQRRDMEHRRHPAETPSPLNCERIRARSC
jgi:hypothetical protein